LSANLTDIMPDGRDKRDVGCGQSSSWGARRSSCEGGPRRMAANSGEHAVALRGSPQARLAPQG